jgi:hypothetical protein
LNAEDTPSIHKRFLSKGLKAGGSVEKKFQLGVGGAARDIEKPKKHRKATQASIAASIEELEKHGLNPEVLQVKDEKVVLAKDDGKLAMDDTSPAKRSRRSNSHAIPLTGAQDEPRQSNECIGMELPGVRELSDSSGIV